MTPQTTLTPYDFGRLHMLPTWMRTQDALDRAIMLGWTLCSYDDPTGPGREGLTPEEAAAIYQEDPDLIYLSRPAVLR